MSNTHKRIRPVMHRVERDSPDINWVPEAREVFSWVTQYDADSQEIKVPVRGGEYYLLVRPGHERHPLGFASDHYKCADHVQVDANILAGCAESITPHAVMMAGHGYQVAYGYSIKHVAANQIVSDGTIRSLKTGLVIAHDHTGKGAMRASMVLYLDRQAIGSLVSNVAMHVAAQPSIWQQNIDAMIETAIIAQDAIVDTIVLASKRSLTPEDRDFLKSKGLRCPESVTTALGALVEHHEGRNQTMTWGVWERRMTDDGFRAVLGLLGSEVAATLDEVLHSHRLSCVPKRFGRKKAA